MTMNKFNQIAVIDKLNLSKDVEDRIREFSSLPVVFLSTDYKDEDEIVSRIGNADAVLGSWNTLINKKILDACPNIKYIGVCGTSVTKIDIEEVKRRGIILTNVTDYGDEATAEFIFAKLLNLVRGFGKYQLKEMPLELNGKTIGIIGLGAVGKQVARLALGFNMNVIYNSRTRNAEREEKGLVFQDLANLLQKSDIISLHVPRNLIVLHEKEFSLIKEGAILVSTCLGLVFDLTSFKKWISKGKNYAIFDHHEEYYEEVKNLPNVICKDVIAGKTEESKIRLGNKVIDNIEKYLKIS